MSWREREGERARNSENEPCQARERGSTLSLRFSPRDNLRTASLGENLRIALSSEHGPFQKSEARFWLRVQVIDLKSHELVPTGSRALQVMSLDVQVAGLSFPRKESVPAGGEGGSVRRGDGERGMVGGREREREGERESDRRGTSTLHWRSGALATKMPPTAWSTNLKGSFGPAVLGAAGTLSRQSCRICTTISACQLVRSGGYLALALGGFRNEDAPSRVIDHVIIIFRGCVCRTGR